MSEVPKATLDRIRKLGKGTRVTFRAAEATEEIEPLEFVEFSATVYAIDREGLWLCFDQGPDVDPGMALLWPDPNWLYRDIKVKNPPPKARSVVPEEPEAPKASPAKPRPKKAKRRADSPEPSSDESSESDLMLRPSRNIGQDKLTKIIADSVAQGVKAALAGGERRPQRRRLEETLVDDDLRDIANGDAGVWTLLVPGLKLPISPPEDIAWAYLNAPAHTNLAKTGGATLGFNNPQEWAELAMAFRMKMGVSFRTVNFANEADHLVANLADLLRVTTARTTKNQWLAPLSLVARLLHLFLLGSSLGGSAAATRFTAEYEKVVASNDSKLNFAALVHDALADKQPQSNDTVQIKDVMQRIDKAVEHLFEANGLKGATPKR
jgi:hypothetical protein